MGMKGVKRLIRKIKNICKRNTDLRRSYVDAYKKDKAFLTELGKFIESYEKCVTQLKEMVEQNGGNIDNGYRRILEKLNQHSAVDQRLLEKVEHLKKKRDDMKDKLDSRLDKPAGKKHCRSSDWSRHFLRMVTYVVFIGAMAAEFACTVVTAVLVTPLVALVIAATIIPTLVGQHWTLSWIKKSPFENEDNIRLMQSFYLDRSTKLKDISTFIKVVKDDINFLVDDVPKLVIRRKTVFAMNEIEKILNNLNKLKEKCTKCNQVRATEVKGLGL